MSITWSASNAPAKSWGSLAASYGGEHVVAAGENLYVSNDYGATWADKSPAEATIGVTCSSDGMKLLAITGGFEGGNLYTSIDAGTSWTIRDSTRQWTGVASSSDGSTLFAVVSGGDVYKSTNSGSSWTSSGLEKYFNCVSCSGNGQYVLAGFIGGLYTSSDYGASFTLTTPLSTANFYRISSSADGSIVLALVETESTLRLAKSSNYGSTWSLVETARSWSSVAISADGSIMLASVSDPSGALYVSTDGGANWEVTESSRDWSVVGLSGTGIQVYAGINGGTIYQGKGPSVIYPVGSTIYLLDDITIEATDELTLYVAEVGDIHGGKFITVKPSGKLRLTGHSFITVKAGTLYKLHSI
jgi:hypothetical protein